MMGAKTWSAELISHTPAAEATVAVAARICHTASGVDEIDESMSYEGRALFIQKLLKMGHESPFEHASFTFFVQCSRSCSHQFVRHRIASYSQQSQRYVDQSAAKYIVPPSIASNELAMDALIRGLEDQMNLYGYLCHLGIPKEDARYVLPNATQTSFMVTMNARSLFNFFKLRMGKHAQWEIRDIANEMYEQCMKVAPNIFGWIKETIK